MNNRTKRATVILSAVALFAAASFAVVARPWVSQVWNIIWLSIGSEPDREDAARVLGEIGSEEALKRLIHAAVSDPSDRVRAIAVEQIFDKKNAGRMDRVLLRVVSGGNRQQEADIVGVLSKPFMDVLSDLGVKNEVTNPKTIADLIALRVRVAEVAGGLK
jgi:hypothetical protein